MMKNKDFLYEAKSKNYFTNIVSFIIPIAFGKKQEWKDGKQVETDEDNIINDTQPAWVLQTR